jgi:hypothetical protein
MTDTVANITVLVVENHTAHLRRKTGFKDFAEARDYSRRRTRDSIERLRKPGMRLKALRAEWDKWGTYCVIEGGDEGYHSMSELDSFLATPATFEQCNWAPLDSDLTPSRLKGPQR